MPLGHIEQVLFHKNKRVPTAAGAEIVPITQAEFRTAYGFGADGANLYYGVNAWQVEQFTREGTALRRKHRVQVQDLLDTLLTGPARAMTLNISLEPRDPQSPYPFLERQGDLLTALASDLHGFQARAREKGKTLQIVIRYASEMNEATLDPLDQPWGRRAQLLNDVEQQDHYKRTFAWLRGLFRKSAPGVEFAFSPVLHRGIQGERFEIIPRYWPGDDRVDVISCTWYARRKTPEEEGAVEGAAQPLRRYLQEWAPKRRPFALDEIGGAIGQGAAARDNDRMLQEMLAVLASPPLHALKYRYVTFFLDGDWGRDARLEFLCAAM